jgi:hypothetical protein
MKYTVVYGPLADFQLPGIWLRAKNRQQVTDAVNYLDQLLRRDPNGMGEPRANGWRILSVPPVAITYQVNPNDRLVIVHSIRLDPDAEAS